jgi:hypothetical protein
MATHTHGRGGASGECVAAYSASGGLPKDSTGPVDTCAEGLVPSCMSANASDGIWIPLSGAFCVRVPHPLVIAGRPQLGKSATLAVSRLDSTAGERVAGRAAKRL